MNTEVSWFENFSVLPLVLPPCPVVFWAKGGIFKGSSWKRAGFLRKIMEEGPGPWEMSDVRRDFKTASGGDGHYIIYVGKEINEYWYFNLPRKNGSFTQLTAGKYKIEIIDTWNMTIRPVNEVFETAAVEDYRLYDKERKKIRLPMNPYLALRATEIKNNTDSCQLVKKSRLLPFHRIRPATTPSFKIFTLPGENNCINITNDK